MLNEIKSARRSRSIIAAHFTSFTIESSVIRKKRVSERSGGFGCHNAPDTRGAQLPPRSMLSARHSRIYQLRTRTPQDAGTQTFSSSRIAAYARKCAAARRADGRRRLPDGYLPQACRARRRGDRPRARQARNRAGRPLGTSVRPSGRWAIACRLRCPHRAPPAGPRCNHERSAHHSPFFAISAVAAVDFLSQYSREFRLKRA